jgi:hypothetical protein
VGAALASVSVFRHRRQGCVSAAIRTRPLAGLLLDYRLAVGEDVISGFASTKSLPGPLRAAALAFTLAASTNPSSAFHLQERDEQRQVGCALPTSKRPEPGRPEVRVYKKLGAVPMDKWTVYRVTGEALERLAASDKVAGRCIKHKR